MWRGNCAWARGACWSLVVVVACTSASAQGRRLTADEISQYKATAYAQLDRAMGQGMTPVAATRAVAATWEMQKQECLPVAASADAKERCADMVIYGNIAAADWLSRNQQDGEAIFSVQNCSSPPGAARRCFDAVILPPANQGKEECINLSRKFASTASSVIQFTCLRRRGKAEPWQTVYVANGGVVL